MAEPSFDERPSHPADDVAEVEARAEALAAQAEAAEAAGNGAPDTTSPSASGRPAAGDHAAPDTSAPRPTDGTPAWATTTAPGSAAPWAPSVLPAPPPPPPARPRQLHRFDPAYLILGLLFCGLATLFFLDGTNRIELDVRWLLPGALIVLGLAGLAASLASRPRKAA